MPGEQNPMQDGHNAQLAYMGLRAVATLLLGLVTYIFLSAIGRLETSTERNSTRISEVERSLVRITEIVVALGEQAGRDRAAIQRNADDNDRQWQALRESYRRGR